MPDPNTPSPTQSLFGSMFPDAPRRQFEWGVDGFFPPPVAADNRPWGGVPYRSGEGVVVDRERPVAGNVVRRAPGAGDGRFDPDGRLRRNPDGAGRRHTGIDYSAIGGTPIRAAADGRVILSADGFKDAGNQVVQRTADGYQPTYFHLSERSVNSGDFVHKGDVIGRTGTTGNAQGTSAPHLHFQVRDPYGRLIDPAQWIEDGVHLPLGQDWGWHGAGARRPPRTY